MLDTQEFISELDGVQRAQTGEYDEHYYIEMFVDNTKYKSINELMIDAGWDQQCIEHQPNTKRCHYTYDKHSIDAMCFMTPHIVSDVDADTINDIDPGEEETSKGFFREAKWIECTCGERFDGPSALNEFKNHENTERNPR